MLILSLFSCGFICMSSVASGYDETNTYTISGISYLGIGYDVITGNPKPFISTTSQYDPGFKISIFDLTSYSKDQTIVGGNGLTYQVPDYSECKAYKAATWNAEETFIDGTTSYSNDLLASVSVSTKASLWGASFSASTEYQTISKSIYSEQNTYSMTEGSCSVFVCDLKTSASLTNDFLTEVSKLPTTFDKTNYADPYYVFLSNFGQFYTSQIELGSRFVDIYEFSQEDYETLYQENVDISVAAKAQWSIIAADGEGVTTSEKEEAEEMVSSSTNHYTSSVGVLPSGTTDYNVWYNNSFQASYPVHYNIDSIVDLFTTSYINSTYISKKNLSTIESNINEAISILCTFYYEQDGCEQRYSDLTPIELNIQSGNIGSSKKGTAQCGSGFKVTGCGIRQSAEGKSDGHWYAYPDSDSQCSCHGDDGSSCHATCVTADAIQGYKIVDKKVNSDTVYCDSGSTVLGCGMKDPGDGSEGYKAVHPNNDLNGCTCYDYYGIYCYAICATNVINANLYSESGDSVISSSCINEPFAFGCGIKLEFSDKSESYPWYYQTGVQTCSSYSAYGTTTYTLCGDLNLTKAT